MAVKCKLERKNRKMFTTASFVCVGRTQDACCGNTVLMVWLGLGKKNHLLMSRKRSCFDLKAPDFGRNKHSSHMAC